MESLLKRGDGLGSDEGGSFCWRVELSDDEDGLRESVCTLLRW